MVAIAQEFTGGLPVEVSRISRELKRLWEQGDGVMTRASLINLAVYSEQPDSLTRNTEIIANITQEHACRAIVIGAQPATKESRVSAWISAHCHVTQAGRKQVCSEQLTFLLEGQSANLLPNVLYSHLDSDLPLHLWWQDDFPEAIDPQLWAWVDRLIYDSRSWTDFDEQMRLVEEAQAEARQRIVLCDLNWTRLLHWRAALAQFFDHPKSHPHLDRLERVEIDHAPENRSTAILLAGWLAAQLDWKPAHVSAGETLVFTRPNDREVKVTLAEQPGEPISHCLLGHARAEFRVRQEEGKDLLDVSAGLPEQECCHQLMPAGPSDTVGLVRDELMRGGPHHVYLRTVGRVREALRLNRPR